MKYHSPISPIDYSFVYVPATKKTIINIDLNLEKSTEHNVTSH